MHKLDNPQTSRNIDRSGMYGHIAGLPEQFDSAWREAKKVAAPAHYIQATNMVVLGMGGSAIGGSLVHSLLSAQGGSKHFHVIRDYQLPHFVDRSSLVIGVSYSGNTEETLSAFDQAAARGAKLAVITSGGELERLASRHRAPIFSISYVSPPRAAIGFLFIPLLNLAARLNFLEFSDSDMAATIRYMTALRSECAREIPLENNRAKQLAQKMQGRIVMIAAAGSLSESARRWKTQINENAKQAAFFEVMPELCHNTIVGLEAPKTLSQDALIILLQSAFDHPQNILRTKLFASILARRGIACETVAFGEPPNPASEIGQSIILGDFVSYYLALLNDIDPSPVEAIVQLKKELIRR